MSDILKEIVEKYGDIVKSGKLFASVKPIVIPVSPALDIALGGGIPEGSFCVFTGQPKCGKEQPWYSKVYTPTGYKQIRDIHVDDWVCTPNGGKAQVIGKYPQGQKDVYRMYFKNGDFVDCGIEHLWKVRNTRKSHSEVLTTKDLLNHISNSDRPRWRIELPRVEFEKQSHIIHPYYMGILLGDGGLTNKSLRVTSANKEIISNINLLLDIGFRYKKLESSNIEYYLYTSKQPNKYRQEIERFGLNTTSKNKFIPYQYKYTSLQDRIHLIRGLMDTDGYISKNNKLYYYSSSPMLIEDFKWMIQSIGGIGTIKEKYVKYKGQKVLTYCCYIQYDDPQLLVSEFKKNFNSLRIRKKKPVSRAIINIKKIGCEESYCIQINDDNHLYVTNNFIVTHNTTTALWFAANAQATPNTVLCPNGRNVHFLGVEGRLKPRDLQGIPHLNLDKFNQICSEPGRILKAHEYLDAADMIIRNDPGCIIIIDSFSALCTEAEMVGAMSDQQRADGPKLLAKFCRKVANVLPVNKVTLIGITHLMANVTGYGAAYQEKSGQSIAYQVDVKLRAKSFKFITLTENGTPVGQEVEWRVECSAIGGPGAIATSYLQYGKGIDQSKELANIAVDLGIIEKKASWFSYNGTKMQGLDKVATTLDSDKALFDQLKNEVYTNCGLT